MHKTTKDAIHVVLAVFIFLFGGSALITFCPTRSSALHASKTSAAETQPTPPDAVISAFRSVVMFRALMKTDPADESFVIESSGWFADSGTLVTTAHSFGPEKTSRGAVLGVGIFTFGAFPFYNVTVSVILDEEANRTPPFVRRNTEVDIGIVVHGSPFIEDAEGAPIAHVRARTPSIGERVWWACSNMQGRWLSGHFSHEGYVAPFDSASLYAGWVFTTSMYMFAPTTPGPFEGCSGTPMFDEEGFVIGMVSSVLINAHGVTIGIVAVRGRDLYRELGSNP